MRNNGQASLKKELVLPGIFFILGIIVFIYWYIIDDFSYALNGVGVFLMPIIPFILRRFKIYIPLSLEIIYFLYAFFAVVLGSCFRLYDLWHPFDFILHFLFGYVGCMFGAYYMIVNKSKLGPIVFLLMCGMFSMGCGAIWELIEFSGDQLLGMNAQLVEQEGIMDTMLDILANFGGVIIFIIHYTIDCRFRNKKFFSKMYSSFSEDKSYKIK